MVSLLYSVHISETFSTVTQGDEDIYYGEIFSKPPLKDLDDGSGVGSTYVLYIVASTGSSSSSNNDQQTTYNTNYDGDYTINGSGISFGHAFIVVENNSSNQLTVGNYTINSNETLSIGLWMQSGTNRPHGGIWYNLENYKADNFSEMDDAVALKKNITLSQVSTISNFILDNNNDYYDLYTYNCTHFATQIWNQISNIHVSNSFGFPSSVKSSIVSNSTHINYTFNNSYGAIGYYNNGIFVNITNPS